MSSDMEGKMQSRYDAYADAQREGLEAVELGARALFLKHYQRNPDSGDLKGLEMDTYRRIAGVVLNAAGYIT